MDKNEYEEGLKRLGELQHIDDTDPRCDEFNELLDKLVDYENEHNIFVTRV